MRMVVFEGTVEEIKELQRELMRGGGAALALSESEMLASADAGEPGQTAGRRFVSREVAVRVLTRRPLSREQRMVISAIYRRHPDWVLATELQEEIGYTTSQFAGLMGAFGRRLVNTTGYTNDTWFFDNQWHGEYACNRYRLPEEVRAAVEQLGLV